MEIKIDGIKHVLTPAQLEAAAKEYEAQKNGPAAKFNALVQKHGYTIDKTGFPEHLPVMDGKHLCIRFPSANREWALAIMKACVEFCSDGWGTSYAWPKFSSTAPGNILRIQTI